MNKKYFCENEYHHPHCDDALHIARLEKELDELAKNTEYQLLLHDGKISELYVYIKENLSNELRTLVDSMILSGEIEELIRTTMTNLQPQIDNINQNVCKLVNDMDTFKLYAPSLINRPEHETINLIKNEHYAILVDTGREESKDTNINFLIEKLGCQKINCVILSHYHLDHTGGLTSLKPLLSDDCFVYLPMNFNNYLSGSDNINELNTIRSGVLNFLISNNIHFKEVDEDTHIHYDDLRIELFNSNQTAYNYYKSISATYNTYSMNVLLKLGNTKVLLPGDSNQYTQDYLLSVNEVEKVDIYASNHHGFERFANIEYLTKLSPEVEYYSNCPYSWDDVNMISYDNKFKSKNTNYLTQAFDEVEINITKTGYQIIKGYSCNDNMFVNKSYTIYVNPSYAGIPDGTKDKPFRTINQALTNLPKEGCNITLNIAPGTYEKLRFVSTNNLIQVVGEGNVVFKDVQINSANAIYFNNIKFIDNVFAVYGYVYFSSCDFECSSNESGNICVTLNRINASFSDCIFKNCYTGIYTQSNAMVTVKGCTINANAYAIYSLNSYVSIQDYVINGGTLRADIGSIIKTIDKGATGKRPVFNNSDYMRGYLYFDTTLGKPIFYYNGTGTDAWIDANGQVV